MGVGARGRWPRGRTSPARDIGETAKVITGSRWVFIVGALDVRRVAFEKFSVMDIPEAYDGRMCILRGKSPRGDFGHVVVARFVGSCDTSLHKMMLTDAGAFRLVHDPHPSSEFLDEGEACAWAMFFSEQN